MSKSGSDSSLSSASNPIAHPHVPALFLPTLLAPGQRPRMPKNSVELSLLFSSKSRISISLRRSLSGALRPHLLCCTAPPPSKAGCLRAHLLRTSTPAPCLRCNVTTQINRFGGRMPSIVVALCTPHGTSTPCRKCHRKLHPAAPPSNVFWCTARHLAITRSEPLSTSFLLFPREGKK